MREVEPRFARHVGEADRGNLGRPLFADLRGGGGRFANLRRGRVQIIPADNHPHDATDQTHDEQGISQRAANDGVVPFFVRRVVARVVTGRGGLAGSDFAHGLGSLSW